MRVYTDKELADYLLEMRQQSGGASLRRYFGMHRWRLVLSFGFIVSLFCVGLLAQSWWFCGFVVGLLIGILSRDRTHVRQVKVIWPFYSKVIDWLKVEKIATGEETA